MSDLIDRQAAIDAMAELQGSTSSKGVLKGIRKAWKRIEQLPPAQPEQLSTNLAEVGTDCISREQAIKTVGWYSCHSGDELLFADNALRQLPPIQPKRGKWVLVCDNNGMHFICNKCGAWRYHQEQNFCGECGADMRGKQDDSV